MKVVIPRETLQTGLGTVQSLVGAKSALPILSNILLRAEGDELTLIATDLEVGIECTVPCTVEEAGTITVPARRLADVVSTFATGDITLDVQDGHLVELTNGLAQFHLLGQPADEFPKSPTFSDDKKITIDQPVLKDVLKKTSFAISTDMNRLALTGMLLDISENSIRFIATDGRRLSYAQLEGIDSPITGSYIVPRKTIVELERLIGEDAPIEIFPAETQVAFRFGKVLLISRVIDGHFPNYKQVIPDGYEASASMSTGAFQQATRRAAVMTSEKNNVIRLTVAPKNMVVATTTPDVGDVHDEVDVTYDGKSVEIGFNPHFLLDILKVTDTDEVSFSFKDALSPGLIRMIGRDDFLYVIMPIKL